MDGRHASQNAAFLRKARDDLQSDASLQDSAGPEHGPERASSSILTLCSTEFDEEEEEDEDEGQNKDSRGPPALRRGSSAEKWEEKGEATLFKRTHQVKKLRQFMPSIIEETEEMCKQEEEDDENEAASKLALVVDEQDTLFDGDFLNFIIETNVIAQEPSQADPDFIQEFSDTLRILRKKLKLEESFAKHIATQLTAMRIKEKVVLLKYIRHILLHDLHTIEEFYKSEGFLTIMNVSMASEEMLDQLPGIILATRGYQSALRQLVDEGVINILVKLAKKTEEFLIAGAAVAQACLVEVQGVEKHPIDAWFESLLDLGSGKSAAAQTYACATLCKMTAHAGQQAKVLQKAGTEPFFKLFDSQNNPEALLWVSGAIANLASTSANFQDFLEVKALAVLHNMSNSIWDEVRLEAAWILVFVSLQKALHQQAVGHWSAWVREALIIGLCSDDALTTAVTRFFFANVTEKETFKGYESPIVRTYLKTLHLSDDLVHEQAEALLYSTARQLPTDLLEALLALCCAEEEAERNIALKALACLVGDAEFQPIVAKYDVLRPFVCGAGCTDRDTQLLCAQILTSFVSDPQSLQDFEDIEPVSGLLYLCDSRYNEVRTAALKGLWVALEVGLRQPEVCAIPILRCCKEDETAETLQACYGRVISEARKHLIDNWGERVSQDNLFGVYSLCTLVHDSSAAVQGRLAYEIEKYSQVEERLQSLDNIGVRTLVYALDALGKSVVDAVKCSVVTVFKRLMSCQRQSHDANAFGSNQAKEVSAPTAARLPFDGALHCFLAESYTKCVCDILLDRSAGEELRQHCLSTVLESLDDPIVCRCFGRADFISLLFSPETMGTEDDTLNFYMVFCKLLTHPETVGHLPNYLSTLQGLLLDAKDNPSLVPPLARLLHASSFLPPVQGTIYSHLKEVCELLIESAGAGASSETAVPHFLAALARLSRVPGSKFQEFATTQSSLPRPVLLALLALLKRYSIATPADRSAAPDGFPRTDRSAAEEGCSQWERKPADMLKSIVEALLALYRLGVMKGHLDGEVTQLHLLPVFQNMRLSNNAMMIPLLSFANSLCEDPGFLDCLLSTSIVSDIASGLAEDSLQNEELCVQVAEFLRVAVLHEGAQEKILADIALVDCIFRLARSSHPAAQGRALFALHSLIAHASILRTIAAENFVPTLCDIALHGKTADVQRVAAGVISTLIARPGCREVLFTATTFMDVMQLVREAGTHEVFLQVVWALSYLPLTDDIVHVLIDKRVPEKFKELLRDDPQRVQVQALNTVAKLSLNEKLRSRFVKLEFLPLLVHMADHRKLPCCVECMKALRLLCNSAAETATALDLRVEQNIRNALQLCLNQKRIPAGGLASPPQNTVSRGGEGRNLSSAGDVSDTVTGAANVDEARSAALALLCQLCNHAVHDQLALLADETIITVIRCVETTPPRSQEERRLVSTLFRIWAGVGRLRKLMANEGGFDVVMKLVTEADDAVEMEELSSCLGSFASEKSATMESRLAESGAIEALQMYAGSRHANVRGSAQRALGNVPQETLAYSQLLADRQSDILGLSIRDQKNRAVLKARRMNAGAAWVPSRQ